MERESNRIAQGFQKRARIPGFRPGKAPLSLVRQHFHSKIREEVLDTLVPAHLRAAFERENLNPVSTPTLDNLDFEPGSPLKFKASFEVQPEFDLGDYRALRISAPSVEEVGAAEVEATIERLLNQHATYAPSSAEAVGPKDVAVVEAEGDKVEKQEIKIEMGSPETLPEFRDAVLGMKIGQEREIEIHYPAEHPNQALAGQERRYQLKLLRIEDKLLPELTDAWVKERAGGETVAELRARIAATMRREREHAARHQAEEAVIAALLQQNPFEVPVAMVDQQVEARVERKLMGLAEQGAFQGMDPRKLKLDWARVRGSEEEGAREQVRAALLLDKIAEREQIEAAPEAVEAEIAALAKGRHEPIEQVRARLTESGGVDRIKGRLRQARVLEFLLDSATAGAALRTPEVENASA